MSHIFLDTSSGSDVAGEPAFVRASLSRWQEASSKGASPATVENLRRVRGETWRTSACATLAPIGRSSPHGGQD